MNKALLFSLLALVAFPGMTEAQMRITEFMYSGNGDEFVEFTNIGATTIDMTGWSFDDDSDAPGTLDLSAFGMVAPGESVIICEATATSFRTDWSLPASIKIIGGYTNNLGRNDEINLYNNLNVTVDQLTYGDEDFAGTIRTQNESGYTSEGNLGTNNIFGWSLSFVGDGQGSYASISGDVGSPGSFGAASVQMLYISEIFFNPPGGDSPNEYVEIRGIPGATINSGTYLVNIEGDSGDPGDVQTIFDLSGLTLGSNGYLVILQNGHTYTTNGSATIIQPSSGSGFSGLALFSSDSGGDIENTSNTFLLIETTTAPTLSDDIDSDNLGDPDGVVYNGWNILDGVSNLDGGSSDCGYANIVFSADGDGLVPAGAIVHALGATPTYAARIGESTGDLLTDWVATGGLDGTAPNWTLPTGDTYPTSLEGRALDHIGSFNFPAITSNGDQMAIWTFDDLDEVCSGTELVPTSSQVRGFPVLQQFFQEIDDNGKGGTAYTDNESVSHPAGSAIAWNDIKGDGDDAELWITLSTLDWSDIVVRFDYRIDDDNSNDSYDLEYSIDGGYTWTRPINNQTLTDDDNWHIESIDLSAENSLENQPCVIFRFSDFDNDGNNEFRFDNIELIGTQNAPDPNAPIIVVDIVSTTDFLDLNLVGCGYVSSVINDPTDPAATQGIIFNVADANTNVNTLIVTATSSNPAVVPNANLMFLGSGSARTLTITPVGVGYAEIEVEVSDGTFSDFYYIRYAASAQLPPTAICHTGASDASTALAIDANYMLVADDENEIIRLYDRNNSGLPKKSFDFAKDLELDGQPREVDIEASVKVGNRIYWIGSHSNNKDGEERPNRSRMFATDISGSGLGTDLTFVDYYQYLKDDLVNWDATNQHGLGANYFGLAASSTDGVLPEASNGFNIEGLVMAPSSVTTAYVCFRAPIVPTTARTKALIVPVANFTALPGASSGSAIFGTPIQLDLGGRGIRSISNNDNDEYLIVAGPAGSPAAAPNNFQLYYWDGDANTAPVAIEAAPTIDNGISFESIVEVPSPLMNGDEIQILADNGDDDWYADGNISKDLPQTNFQKFCSGRFLLDLCPIDNTSPTALCQNTTIQLDANGAGSIVAADIDGGSTDACGIASLVADPAGFGCENVGTNTVTLTVTDNNGNTNNCTASVIVEDNVAPNAVCQNTTVQLNDDGNGSIVAADIDGGSNDACGIASIAASTTEFTCEQVGDNTVTLTVIDVNGNSSTCNATVTVEDNLAPEIIICQGNSIDFNGEDEILSSTGIDFDAEDACGIATITYAPEYVYCEQLGETVPVRVTVTDVNGNSNNCVANVLITGLPCGWMDFGDDGIGCVESNDASYDVPTETFTLESEGCFSTNWSADNAAYVKYELCGDGEIIAHVASMSPIGGGWAGISARESEAPGSKKVALATNLGNFLRREIRTTTNGYAIPQQFFRPSATWLKITRMGNQFIGSASSDGVNWQMVLVANVPMTPCIQFGLYLTNTNAGTLTASFDNVEVIESTMPSLSVPDTDQSGVDESSFASQDFRIFPNPAKDGIQLDLSSYYGQEVQVEILNQLGQSMLQRKVAEVGSSTERFNLSGWSDGTYFVRVVKDNEQQIKKFVIVR